MESISLAVSDMEATYYYAGLPSSPRLLARTGTALWQEPEGPEAYRKLKQLRVVVDHKLNTVWEDNVAPKVHTCLDELGVQWTSTDIVRICEVGVFSTLVILWIGVKPESLSNEGAKITALRCLSVLKGFDITDVDVEIRESSVTRSAGPKLLPPALSSNPTVDVRHPLTYALGLPVSAEATPSVVGTGGFFMAEGGNSNKLFLITARHVVLPLNKAPNNKFECKTQSDPRFNVLLLGDKAYESFLASIMARIGEHRIMAGHEKLRIEAVGGQDNEEANAERDAAQRQLNAAEGSIEALYTFYNGVKRDWATVASRVLGRIVFSPPLRLGAGIADEQYTEDYAIIEVDEDKIDGTNFKGNMIDLGTKIPIQEFAEKMFPNLQINAASFRYPVNRLLRLQGIISNEEMRHPTMYDQNGEPSLTVIKNGSTTGVTIGCANGIMSYVREYFEDGSHQTSKEWAILPYDSKSGAFSAPGDSGAVIVDGYGRVGGLLTGGTGSTDSLDISYATPISFLLKSIKANGYPNADFISA